MISLTTPLLLVPLYGSLLVFALVFFSYYTLLAGMCHPHIWRLVPLFAAGVSLRVLIGHQLFLRHRLSNHVSSAIST